ncbi:MAG: FeoA family protein [Sporomusaceae bacterium]|nr:FeoA family protein [Sporomusaceae bacterium]
MYKPEASASLADLLEGTACQVSSVELDGLLRRRVLDLGILPGTRVECVRKSPSGDPIAFRVRETVIALRSNDASCIKIHFA